MHPQAHNFHPAASPLVSVIIPTYQHAGLILQTLDSVFGQTLGDFEVIVVNDGSPDDTARVLDPLARANRIRYFEQPNQGQAAARNRALAEARGEFVAFLDDDDLWPADHLSWLSEEMAGNPDVVLVYGYCQTFGGTEPSVRLPESDGPSGDVLARFTESAWLRSPGQGLIRRSALNAIGGFDPAIRGTDDWDLYLRLARCGTFVYRDHLALRYRVHSSNASNRFDLMYRNGCKVARKNFPADDPATRKLRMQVIDCARRFTVDQGMRVLAEQRAENRRMQLLATLAKLASIDPSLLCTRSVQSHFAWAMTPSPIFRILRRLRAGTTFPSKG